MKTKMHHPISSSVLPGIDLKGFKLPFPKDVESVGQLLREIRLFLRNKYNEEHSQKFTQGAVAKFMGYDSPQYVYLVEMGKSEPALDLVTGLCEYYGIPKDYMYEILLEFKARVYKKAFFGSKSKV